MMFKMFDLPGAENPPKEKCTCVRCLTRPAQKIPNKYKKLNLFQISDPPGAENSKKYQSIDFVRIVDPPAFWRSGFIAHP